MQLRAPSRATAARTTLPLAGPSDPRPLRPGTYARAELPPEPAAAGRVRRLTRDTLAGWHLDGVADDAELIAAELFANALDAATGPHGTLPAIIYAIHRRPGEVRIIVWDNGPGKPERTQPRPDAENGRGLAIVDALTDRNWGWWPTPLSGGKVVWAAIPADAGHPVPGQRDRPVPTPVARDRP